MIFNKSYLTTFSKNKPHLALASKGKIIDSKFTLSSELSLYDYSQDIHYSALQTDSEYCKLEWCEKDNTQILACGHTNGTMALYEPCDDLTTSSDSFKLIKQFEGLNGKVLGINYNVSKNVIAAGSANGNIIFLNLDKLDQQYKCDIPINENITSLAWNNKVSRILCAGTECGKILILDIRAKQVAMTIQNKDIKTINNVKWHPKSSTSIFASTNLPHLACFKLDSNSMTQIGKFNSSTINFDNLNDETVVCYSDNEIDYINVDTLEVKEVLKVENVFDISFSKKDPIYCCSYNSGTTEVFTKLLTNSGKGLQHVQFGNFIVGEENLKIKMRDLEINSNDSIEKRIVEIMYPDKVFKFNDKVRLLLGNLFLEESQLFSNINSGIKNDGIVFDLKDDVVKSLITKNFDNLDLFDDRKISLKSVIQLLDKNDINTEDPIEFLLSLCVSKKYEKLCQKISSSQWTIIIAILLHSDLTNEEVIENIRKLSKNLQIPILNLFTNDTEQYFKGRETNSNLTDNLFEIRNFYEKIGNEIFGFKKLGMSYDNPLVNEFFWYAKDHGKYEEIKDLDFKDNIIRTYIGLELVKKRPVDEGISKMQINTPLIKPKLEDSAKADKPSINTPPIPTKPSLYGTSSNRSMTSFSTKPVSKTPNQEASFNKPAPPKKSLYSGVPNRSASSFSTRPEVSPQTYGQQKSVSSMGSQSIPKPFNTPKSPVSTPICDSTPVSTISLDPSEICQKFEQVFNVLREKASKKNNLIVGNKIKDAVRRFQLFEQINKNEMSQSLLDKINQILSVINSEDENGLIKTKVRGLIDDFLDCKEHQSDIWLPAIGILVQLVY